MTPPSAQASTESTVFTDRTTVPVPYRHWLLLGPLAVSLASVMMRAQGASDYAPELGISALFVAWYLAWDRYSWDRPLWGRTLAQGVFTFVGAALLGVLILKNDTFFLAYPSFLLRCFLAMPFGWAFAAMAVVLAPGLSAALPAPSRAPTSSVTVLVFRLVVVAVIGVFVRTLTLEIARRRKLTEELVRAERRAGQFEERQRFARDIHDTLAQGFAGIVVHLETAELERARDAAGAARHTDSALIVARQSLEEARRMMGAMLPEALDGRDLAGAIVRTANEWQARTGVACEVIVTGDPRPLDRDIEIAMLRVAQEALTNVWKHAQAQRVTVTLSHLEDVVLLDVLDDGVGMKANAGEAGASGFGLHGMRARIELLGGTLTVESSSEGSTITASVPAVPPDTATWPASHPGVA